MNYYAISAIINLITSLSLAVILVKALAKYRAYLFFNLSIALWSLFYFLWQISPEYAPALLFCRVLTIGSIYIAYFFLKFIIDLVSESPGKYKVISVINKVCAGVWTLLAFTPLLVRDVLPVLNFKFWPVPGILYIFFVIYFCMNLILSLWIMYKKYAEDNKFKETFVFITIAILFAFVGGSTNYFLWFGIKIPPVGNILVTVNVLIVAYAILKHELMDIRLFVTRSAAYGITGVCFISSFVISDILIESRIIVLLLNVVLACFWVFFWYPLRKLIQTPLQEKWITDWYDDKELMSRITDRLIPVFEKEAVLEIVAEEIKETIKINGSFVYTASFEGDELRYVLSGSGSGEQVGEFSRKDKFINYLLSNRTALGYGDMSQEIKVNLKEQGFSKVNMFLPFHSSEKLEGLIIFAGKISEDQYDEKDKKVFDLIIKHALLVFDRMTPYEQVKSDYERSLKYAEKLTQQAAYATLTMGIAHEIRNPLGMIRLGTEALKKKLDDKEAVIKFADNTAKLVDRLTNIMENMLKFKSATSTEKQAVNINELLEQILFLAEAKCKENDIILMKEIIDTAEITGDQTRLYQVFMNLFLNAIEAIGKEGIITVRIIRTRFVSKQGQNIEGVAVSIRDSGCGIAEENISRIFDSFYSTKYMNTGLGLAIVLKIIDEHDGMIDVKSTVGDGSVFTVYLPVNHC
ncbi:MAG TPA: hypothetical protein DF296_10770 [Candidatus Margulisbacteria bacterium]|nr:hypothetical protein [Candidatus Margulisiibacteriota bacterium]